MTQAASTVEFVEPIKAGRVIAAFRVKAAMIPKGRTYYVGDSKIKPGDRIAKGAVISAKPASERKPLHKLAETVAPALEKAKNEKLRAKEQPASRVTKADMAKHGIEIGQGVQVEPANDVTKDTINVLSTTTPEQAIAMMRKRNSELLGDDEVVSPREGFDDTAWDKVEGKTDDPADPWAGVDLDAEVTANDADLRPLADLETPLSIRRRNAALLGDDDGEAPEATEEDFKRARTVDLGEERQRRIDQQREKNSATEERAREAKVRVEKIVRIDSFARDQLRKFVQRIERCEKERKAIAADIKEIMGEAKGKGFDTKIIRKLIAIRKIDADTREEELAMLDIYMDSVGMGKDDNDSH
jgi:uncharacterized protein (UPF0335 family)